MTYRTSLPARDDFPVHWDHPADASAAWSLHRDQHNPSGQVSPLEFDLYLRWALEGIGHACTEFGRPVTGVRALLMNTYPYFSICPALVDADVARRMHLTSDQVIERYAMALQEDWPQRYLPRIRELLLAMETPAPASLSDDALAGHLVAVQEYMAELWRIHFLIDFPSHVAVQELEELHNSLFDDCGFAPYRLLGGVANLTVEGAQQLWRLARRATELAGVPEVLTGTDAAEVPKVLEGSAEGRMFLEELRAYLDVHGRRGDDISPTMTSWVEDPVPALHGLVAFLDQPESEAPAAVQRRAWEDARCAAQETRARLVGCPRPVAELFERLLEAARYGTMLGEDHAYYIDYGASYLVRQAVLEAGRRLTARGALAERDDVFGLHLDELTTALRDPRADRRDLAARRAAEAEHFSTVAPPSALGAGTPYKPPAEGWFERLTGGYEGDADRSAPVEEGTLTGSPGSPGSVRGIARVLSTLGEADRLAHGDVLVAKTTSSTWSPLFAVAGAVVTEVGGVLSHSAVVAREYGIPAVVGARGATAALRDGQYVEVDGDRGLIRVIEAGGR